MVKYKLYSSVKRAIYDAVLNKVISSEDAEKLCDLFIQKEIFPQDVIQAMDKATARRPKTLGINNYWCPVCNKEFHYPNPEPPIDDHSYCARCGQKFAW